MVRPHLLPLILTRQKQACTLLYLQSIHKAAMILTKQLLLAGWDLHRLEEGKRLVIGGIDIPHSKGTIAHSDGRPPYSLLL